MSSVKPALYKYIHCDVYKRGIVVFIGSNTQLRAFAKKVFKEPDEFDIVEQVLGYSSEEEYSSKGVAGRCFYSENTGQSIIHLPIFDFKYNPQALTNLSHEILHATFGMLDFVGVEYRYGGNNEAFTYLFEYFYKEALREQGYKKFSLKNKK